MIESICIWEPKRNIRYGLLFRGFWERNGRGGDGRGGRGRENNLGAKSNLVRRGMAIVWRLFFFKGLFVKAVHFSGGGCALAAGAAVGWRWLEFWR